MKTPADLTILLGPQTTATQALNTILRESRHKLSDAGLFMFPSRLAMPILKRSIDDRPLKERRAEFKKETERRPAFLSAINFLGPPHAGLARSELMPDAELALAGLQEIAPKACLVMAIDPLPAFFLAAGSDALEARVRDTPWELLYELSWADLIREVTDMVPKARVMVLTTARVGAAPGKAFDRILGKYAEQVQPANAMLRHLISETGRAVLDRIEKQAAPDAETLEEVYSSFALKPSKDDIQQRLGIDKVTTALLEQRFQEDLDSIEKMPNVEVL